MQLFQHAITAQVAARIAYDSITGAHVFQPVDYFGDLEPISHADSYLVTEENVRLWWDAVSKEQVR